MTVVQADIDFKQPWNDFVKVQAFDGGLLQSWEWGDFQKFLDRKIFRFVDLDSQGQIQAVALAIRHEIHFEYNYFYCPRGPVVNFSKVKSLNPLFKEIFAVAKEEKSFLLRCDPAWTAGNEKFLSLLDFRKDDSEVQPKCSLIIDISRTEEEILAAMKQKTRYNIHLAQRSGVKITISQEISDIETLWQLMKQTSERDGFSLHPKEHYKKMFEIFAPSGTIKLFLAEYEAKIIAANLVAFFGRVCTYLHGASADMYRGAMAPYLLQWQAIVEAKRLGYQFYDLSGVNAKTFNDEKWAGLTRFKTGFAPQVAPQEYIGSFEAVLNPFIYSAYKFVKQIRG